MTDRTAFKLGTRIVDREGNVGTVIETPWDTASGWSCKVQWDSNKITASGTSNQHLTDLTII
jgi:hypothetical protein